MAILIGLFERLSVRKRRGDFPALRSLLAADPDTRILDLGGGGGSATSAYADGLAHVTVLEPDPRKIAYGRRRHPHLTFVEGHAESLPFPDASFDRVVAIVSFHHVDDPQRVLAEIRRILTAEGRIVFFELQSARHAGPFTHFMGRRCHGTDPHFYEPEELRRLLTDAGVREIVVQEGGSGYFVSGRP